MITGTLSGRLTADPQVHQGQNSNFTSFSVAVNHGKKNDVEQVTFVDCTANGKTGELIAQRFKKGNVFAGPAVFSMREYESNGQKKQSLSAAISMIDWQASQPAPQEQTAAAPAPAPTPGYAAPPTGYGAPLVPPAPGYGAPPPIPPAPAAPPAPAPQYHTDQYGNQYQLVNGQWMPVGGPVPTAPAVPQYAQPPQAPPAPQYGAPVPSQPPQGRSPF